MQHTLRLTGQALFVNETPFTYKSGERQGQPGVIRDLRVLTDPGDVVDARLGDKVPSPVQGQTVDYLVRVRYEAESPGRDGRMFPAKLTVEALRPYPAEPALRFASAQPANVAREQLTADEQMAAAVENVSDITRKRA